MSDEDEVQEIINELIEIKRRSGSRLSKRDVPRVRELFRYLKKKYGFSAKDFEQMTGEEYKEAAIKPYISGVKPEKDSIGPQAQLTALADMARRGLTFDMVTQANSIKKTLDSAGVSLNDVSELISDVLGAGMSIQDFVSTVKQVKASEIPIVDLGKAFSYRNSLDAMGIDTKMLGKLVETISKQGSLDDLQNNLNSMRSEITQLEEKKKAIQVALDLYEHLEKKGFNQEILGKIMESSRKYGEPTKVPRSNQSVRFDG